MIIRMIKVAIVNLMNHFGYSITMKEYTGLSLYDDFPVESLNERRFYNIGAGSFSHPYWTNIDYHTSYYSNVQKRPFINYDLMALAPLPIESNVAEIVYSSHTIEHVSNEAVQNMLREAYRILKPSGYIRLTTPDASLEFDAYRRNDLKFWYWIDRWSKRGAWEKLYKVPLSRASIHQLFLHHFASQLSEIAIDDSPEKKYSDIEIKEILSKYSLGEALDYFTQKCKYNPLHPGHHINWWTDNKLINFLKEAGFSECYRSGYGQSRIPPLRDTHFFDNLPNISLFVEAIK